MARAKSRLLSNKSHKFKKSEIINTKTNLDHKNSSPKSSLKNKLQQYLKHLPTFFLGLIFSASTYLILTKISPTIIQHFILPNTYLPFLFSATLSVFFLFSFFLLNTRRGLLISILFAIFLFLRLQQTLLQPLSIFIIIIPFFVIEIIFSLINKRS